MSTDNIKLITKCIGVIAAITGAVVLIATGHGNESGWGWLVLLAFMISA